MSVVMRVPQLAKMPMPPDQTIDASCVFALSMKAAEAQPTRGAAATEGDANARSPRQSTLRKSSSSPISE
jgi:hypothetical protein